MDGHSRHARDERQRLGTHQVFADHGGGETRHALLLEIAQHPVALHAALEFVVGVVSQFKAAHDFEQLRRAPGKRRRLAIEQGDQLALIDEVDVAPQGRARPGVLRHAQARVGRGLQAHARLEIGLRAIDGGNSVVRQQLAPGCIDENHQFGHHQIDGAAAQARDDGDAPALDRKTVIDAVALIIGLFTAQGFQLRGQAPQCGQGIAARPFDAAGLQRFGIEALFQRFDPEV